MGGGFRAEALSYGRVVFLCYNALGGGCGPFRITPTLSRRPTLGHNEAGNPTMRLMPVSLPLIAIRVLPTRTTVVVLSSACFYNKKFSIPPRGRKISMVCSGLATSFAVKDGERKITIAGGF
jgi:hypothetical protein